MEKIKVKDCNIEIFTDSTYSIGSVDNKNKYDDVFSSGEYQPSTLIGLKLYDQQENDLIKSVLLTSDGGATGLHAGCYCVDEDSIAVCVGDTLCYLTLCDLSLLWQVKADAASCFGVYPFKNDFVVHGELEISRIDTTGKKLWGFSGKDIFTSPDSVPFRFEIANNHIFVTDWNGDLFKIDSSGNGELVK